MGCKLISILVLVFCSCGTMDVVEKKGEVQEKVQAEVQENENIKNFPSGVLNSSDGYVHSNFDADIVSSPLSKEGEKIFHEYVVYGFHNTYSLYDKEHSVDYYAIVFDFVKTIDETGNIKQGDIIGKIGEDDVKVLVFSQTMDPYLVINGDQKPYYYDGFYWFDAAFLFPSGNTNWLSFNQTDNVEDVLLDVANHATEGPPGTLFYPRLRVRYKTTISEYPRLMTDKEKERIGAFERMFYGRNNMATHVTEIQAGDFKYLLCWQSGFDQYLKNEYRLNDDIWIYGSIITYDVWDNCGYVFIRDFKLETLEEMYEGRLEIINEK